MLKVIGTLRFRSFYRLLTVVLSRCSTRGKTAEVMEAGNGEGREGLAGEMCVGVGSECV